MATWLLKYGSIVAYEVKEPGLTLSDISAALLPGGVFEEYREIELF